MTIYFHPARETSDDFLEFWKGGDIKGLPAVDVCIEHGKVNVSCLECHPVSTLERLEDHADWLFPETDGSIEPCRYPSQPCLGIKFLVNLDGKLAASVTFLDVVSASGMLNNRKRGKILYSRKLSKKKNADPELTHKEASKM
jgi:hypothetical protein